MRIESLLTYYEGEKEKLDKAKENIAEVKKEIEEEMETLGITSVTQETSTGAKWSVVIRETKRETVTKAGKEFLKSVVLSSSKEFIKTTITTSTVIKKVG